MLRPDGEHEVFPDAGAVVVGGKTTTGCVPPGGQDSSARLVTGDGLDVSEGCLFEEFLESGDEIEDAAGADSVGHRVCDHTSWGHGSGSLGEMRAHPLDVDA
jgi:hypothetical protein